jgi:hypothetical protein
MRPNSQETSTAELVATFKTQCPATACKTDCASLVTKIDQSIATTNEKNTFTTSCKVEAPAKDEGNKENSGTSLLQMSKFLLLTILSTANFYFLS